MGTRATITFEEDGKPLATLYRQIDGYPSGLGDELASYLKRSSLVNGYTATDSAPYKFNGIGCLAAYAIGMLKLYQYKEHREAIGNVYMVPVGERQEYNYFVYAKDEKPYIRIEAREAGEAPLWEGAAHEFDFKGVA